ncbi:MAG TPA: acyl-CoA dehydrogenase family protein [Thermomicrobiales bacterium]|nr:acyl-CoA dehydrogenase family protein [Thermomicrobiales bacterium]
MDFDFSEEQSLLRNVAREFLTEQCPVAHVRAMMEDATGYDKGIYRQMADLGLLGLPFPESYGGSGLGMVEQAIVLEEMGRVAYPGPYFAGIVLAGGAVMASGDDAAKARYLPGLATGELTATLAFLEDDLDWGPRAIGLRATSDGDGYRLNGIKRVVPFGHAVDIILVAARTDDGAGPDGVTLLAVPRETAGLTVDPNTTLDLDSKVSTLHFDNVRVPADGVVGAPGGAWPALAATLERAAVAAAAEQLGATQKCLEMSVGYAKVREQFGQPIGSFQAIKHKLAEMLELAENAHSAVYYAAWAQDAAAPDAALSASVAKSTLNEASRRVCGEAIQVHGGIGFTWEYDLHLYWKRAKHLEPLYGDTDYHRERVLAEVLAGRVAGVAAG